jgi:hypothetical protein
MPYFPVDDQAAFHPKMLAAGNAAVGVWTRSGAWCKAHTSGGFVPESVAHAIGSRTEIRRLLTAGLWSMDEEDGIHGYRFHDWQDQAGNFDAETEKAKKEAERKRNRDRKRRQRERDKQDGHGVTPGVTPEAVTAGNHLPPSPSPLTTDRHTRPVLETDVSQGPDESESVEAICIRQAAALGVDFAKVKTAIGKACGRFPDPSGVVRIIVTVLERAKPPVKSPTGLVLAAVRDDWAEWQQMLDEAVA